jgi:hypothetical protein
LRERLALSLPAGSGIGAFYRDQRVIDNEAFWVDILP